MISLCHLKGGVQTRPASRVSAAERDVRPHLPGPSYRHDHSRKSVFGGLDHIQPLVSSLLVGSCGNPVPGGFGLSER